MYLNRLLCAVALSSVAALGQSTPTLHLPTGYTQRVIGTTSSSCVKVFTDPFSTCTTSGDTRIGSFGVGNTADLRGFMYSVSGRWNSDNTPAPIQQLFKVSPDGAVATVGTFDSNATCTASASKVEGTSTARTLSVLGYNLAAVALYVRVDDQTVKGRILNPQDGFYYQCMNGGLSVLGTDGTKIPQDQETSTATTTVIKITWQIWLP